LDVVVVVVVFLIVQVMFVLFNLKNVSTLSDRTCMPHVNSISLYRIIFLYYSSNTDLRTIHLIRQIVNLI